MTQFNAKEHLIMLKNKNSSSEYLPVQWRLVWFREACPDGTIETEMLHLDLDKEVEEEAYVWNNEKKRSEKVVKVAKGVAIFKATIRDGKGGVATGTKMEKAVSFGDFLEKSETGAIGRALAALGYGTQFTGDELNEQPRIVDSHVETRSNGQDTEQRAEAPVAQQSHKIEAQPQSGATGKATAQQLSAIAAMGKQLGQVVELSPNASFEDAGNYIVELQAKLKEARRMQASGGR